MIYFEKDWQGAGGLPRAVIHKETRNDSFLRMVVVLRKMNVKNCYFHLALIDETLRHVDPHAPNLTQDQKLRIARECRFNVWYYLREVIRVPASGGPGIPFQLTRANLAMVWCFYNNIDFTGTQPRQTGKTMGAICISSHIMYFYGFNIKMAMYTHSAKLVQENVARLKEIRDALPKYLVSQGRDDTDNKEGLSYRVLNNHYSTYVGQKDKQAAANVGRGQTFPSIHGDEIGFIPNIDISFPVLLAAQGAARENAKRNGQPHANLYTTTAARTDTDSGRYAFKLVNDAMRFTEKLYDCADLAAARAMIKANSTNGVVNGTFSYLQLGKSHEWLIETTQRTNATQAEINRDYLNMWESGSEFGLIPTYLLDRMNATKAEPEYIQVFNEYTVSWYVPAAAVDSMSFRAKPFIMGMDSSEMIGRDFTTFVMIDPTDMRVVATFRCNESNVTKLGMFIGEFLVTYPGCVFIPERKSTGLAIIDTVSLILLNNNYNPAYRIFNKIVDDFQDEAMQRIAIHDRQALTDSIRRKYFGFITTGTTRTTLYKNTMQKAVQMNADRIFDATLINEFSCLVTKNGRVDHAADSHDDLVIAYLLACWLVFEGKNLHMYGLRPEHLMSSLTATGEKVDPGHVARQLELRRKIKHFETLIRTAEGQPTLQNSFRHRMNQLLQYIDPNVALEPVSATGVRHELNTYGNIFGGVTAAPGLARPANAFSMTQLMDMAHVA